MLVDILTDQSINPQSFFETLSKFCGTRYNKSIGVAVLQ